MHRQHKRDRADVPIIAFTSDFGLSDPYVAEMKAVVLRGAPNAVLVDVTHGISRHDILAGSTVLERALAAFGAGTVHIAVVDPGVGTPRRLLVAKILRQLVLCPDNGLVTWALRRHGGVVRELTWRPPNFSATFHGRDVLAPAAAMLARGRAVGAISRALTDPVLLNVAPASAGRRRGR